MSSEKKIKVAFKVSKQKMAHTFSLSTREDNYLADTHTAVALDVYRQYVESSGDSSTPTVVVSTASPYKFVGSVLSALETLESGEEFENILQLESITNTTAPAQLKALQHKPIRFDAVIKASQAAGYVLEALGIGE